MSSTLRKLSGVAGISAALGVNILYATSGYKPWMPLVLLATVAFIAFFLSRARPSLGALVPGREDLAMVAILLVIMVPLYWWHLYTLPWQVNTDEVTIMQMSKDMTSVPSLDLLGIGPIFGFPSAVFVFVGRLAKAVGGIDLFHYRLVHSSLGLVCVLLSYGFFRQLMRPVRALAFAIILGANHALFAISRMAMRENTSLLLELLALWLLTRGIRRRSLSEIFLGGVSAGLAFYAYFPGRITVAIGLCILAGAAIVGMSRDVLKTALRYAMIFVVGWAVAAAPVMIDSNRKANDAFGYARQQFLFYPEGRALQQQWTGQQTGAEAWKANIKSGLTMFNRGLHDQGYIYPNYRHAFVDPLTGVLLWIGLLICGARVIRGRKELLSDDEVVHAPLGDFIAIIGFLMIYLSSAFLITKAPNYTRLLIVLPFVSYLAGTAIWSIAGGLMRLSAGEFGVRRRRRVSLAYACVAVIAVWNIAMFKDFANIRDTDGNDVGGTGRYIEARKTAPLYSWIIAADSLHHYYSWGGEGQWRDWAGFFAGPSQSTKVTPVPMLTSMMISGDFTVFIAGRDWHMLEPQFRIRFPLYEVKWLTPDSRLLAIDVRQPGG